MAIGIEQYRRAIGLGGFAPLKRSCGSCSIEPCVSILGALVIMSLLVACGDVESNPGPDPDPGEPTVDENTRTVLSAINTMKAEMNTRFDKLDDRIKEIEKENVDLRKEVDSLHGKIERMENESRKKRLLIYGLPGSHEEPRQDTDRKVRELFTRIGISDMKFDEAYRIRKSGTKKPVIVTFLGKADKFTFIEKLKSADDMDNIFAKQDLPPDVREKRRKLSRFYNYAVGQGKSAKVVWDKLVVDGVGYEYDPETNAPKEIRR